MRATRVGKPARMKDIWFYRRLETGRACAVFLGRGLADGLVNTYVGNTDSTSNILFRLDQVLYYRTSRALLSLSLNLYRFPRSLPVLGLATKHGLLY